METYSEEYYRILDKLKKLPKWKRDFINNNMLTSKHNIKIIGDNEMQETAKQIVVNYFNSHVDKTDNTKITLDNVYIVWFAKTLQNWKALVSTNVSDGMYYEITHNGDKNETYVDVYKKWENFTV